MITGVGSVNGACSATNGRAALSWATTTPYSQAPQGCDQPQARKIVCCRSPTNGSMPVMLFAEGGGGRPGDDWPSARRPRHDDIYAFGRAQRSRCRRVESVSGRCFAGNAALLGSCDVIIADKNVQYRYGRSRDDRGRRPRRVPPGGFGPLEVQVPSGVIDVLVEDEAECVAAAKKYLGYFQGRMPTGPAPTSVCCVTPCRRTACAPTISGAAIETLADTGSVLELRPSFGKG